jgi:hypothetical protein
MQTIRKLTLLTAGLLLLSGCGLRTWVDVTIAEDSSGTLTLHVASDQALRDGLATFSPDVNVVDQLTDGLSDQGWEIAPAPADGEWEGVIATQSFADLQELKGLLGEALQGGDSNLELVETDDAYKLSADLGPPASGTNEADLFAQVSDVIDVDGRLSVAFPVEVTETNGTVSDDGRTVTWAYDEESIAGLQIFAEAEEPGQNGIVVAVVLALGFLVGFGSRRVFKRKPRASTGD